MDRIVECVPNFSEGRDAEKIKKIEHSIAAVPGVKVLGVSSGAAANRTVITFIGSPEAVCEAAFQAVSTAALVIDMRTHSGEHPRSGATDVLPLVPVKGISLEECAELARKLAKRIFTELGIGCYCYEAAAFKPERKKLEYCRKGGYEALPQRFTDPELRPDFCPDSFDRQSAKSGVTIVGARKFLIAVNFNIDSKSAELATEIAKDVRESGRVVTKEDGSRTRIPGTLKGCKAIGWYIEEYGNAQVSVNITDVDLAPLDKVRDEVSRFALTRGTRVTGTEIIGFLPEDILRIAKDLDMKVLMVADAGSIHTKRWAVALKEAGIDLRLFSVTPADEGFYSMKDIRLYGYDLFAYKKERFFRFFKKIRSHFQAVKELKKILDEFRPDILHAHYATSYSLVSALAGYRPLIVSIWGSDIYEFPRLSWVNRKMVEFVLGRADRVLSTSKVMTVEAGKYYQGDFGITPFGVDTDLFSPGSRIRDDGRILFGTAKTLSRKYGIDLLIQAFALAKKKLKGLDVGLVIAGDGPDREALEELSELLEVSDSVEFKGSVAHYDIPAFYTEMDVAVFLSREESFGVSAVEAMSCGVPVIASAADGFREVLEGGGGIIVPKENVNAAAEAMVRMARDESLRHSYGTANRQKVLNSYDWKDNVQTMISEYRNILDR